MTESNPSIAKVTPSKGKPLLENLRDCLENLTTLTITTTVTGSEERELRTDIQLLMGDISNRIHSSYLTDENQKGLVEFHESQVAKGQQIIKDNVDAIRSILELVKSDDRLNPAQDPGQGGADDGVSGT